MKLHSWDYDDDPPAVAWLRRARAYTDASRELFAAIERGNLPRTYHHAQAAAFLFFHALESFLKAGLVAAGQAPGATHRLDTLYARFRKHFAGPDFEFKGAIADLTRPDPMPANEYLRYPTDSNGKPWIGSSYFDLGIWSRQVDMFRDDFERMEDRIVAGAV